MLSERRAVQPASAACGAWQVDASEGACEGENLLARDRGVGVLEARGDVSLRALEGSRLFLTFR